MPDSLPEDPHAAREQAKYSLPIPSREFIRDHIKAAQTALTHPKLCRQLALDDDERREALRRRLIAMTRDGELVCSRSGRYTLAADVVLVKGTVLGHRDGYGFLQRDDAEPDLFLSARQMQAVFPGDRVLAREDERDARGRQSAVIIEVLEHKTHQLVGRFFREGRGAFVEAENNKISQRVMLDKADFLNAQHGQYVVVELTRQPNKYEDAFGKVIEVLGDHMAPGMEIEVALRNYDIPFAWPEEVNDELKHVSTDITPSQLKDRVDLRHLPLVTIDGEDAKDFDDAVYCERKKSGGWRLYVAIADVSSYVPVGSALDTEARERGTSVYFPEHVVPMLPELLSNGLCSLNPHVDRLCMVCEMTISEQGRLSGQKFYEAAMHSNARLTYTKVGLILLQPDSPEGTQLCEDYAELLPHLHELYQLYEALRAERSRRGAIDFETVETRIIFGEERKIERIGPVQRNDAHKIIEECMLCANVAAAQVLRKSPLTSLFRLHEAPGSKKLENLRAFLSELGLQLAGGEQPSSADYQRLSSVLGDRPDRSVIQTMMLRSMSQARYGAEEEGHFGLSYKHYTHFTSPIRRYPDLLVHRALKALSRGECTDDQLVDPEQPASSSYPYTTAQVVELGEHCSMTERRADEATRDVVNWLKCEFLSQHVGEEYDGLIVAVTSFGFFVELQGLFIEGLVHISNLGDDYYQFHQAQQRLIGERSGRSFSLGDSVRVQVARVDLEERTIDLLLSASSKSTSRGKRRSAKDRLKLLDDFAAGRKSGKRGAKRGKSSSTSKPDKASKGTKSSVNKKHRSSKRKP